MHGIFAIIQRSGQTVPRQVIASLSRSASPHGPPAIGVYTSANAALICARSDFVHPIDDDRQPVVGGGGRFVVVLDGRLDNREELAAKLGDASLAADTAPDSAILMRGWERWQSRIVEHLTGDFAFIVWDSHEQRLFAARDHFGLRPLSYHATAAHIAIASTPQTLFAAGCLSREPDLQKLADTLVENYKDAGRSFYKDVKRLPPAHVLVADRRDLAVRSYWTLDPSRRIRLAADSDYAEAARELAGRAVKARLRGTGTVGIEMSAGLDSSLVTVTALDHLDQQPRLPTFTVVPETSWDRRWDHASRSTAPSDEGPGVLEIGRMHPRLEPHLVAGDGLCFDDGFSDRLRHASTLSRSLVSASMWHGLYRAARAHGVTVLLNGIQGNATVTWAGKNAYAYWLRTGQLATLARELRLVGKGPVALARRFLGLALLPGGPRWLQALHARLRPGEQPRYGSWQSFSLVNPEFARTWRVDARAAELGWNFLAHDWDRRSARIDALTRDVPLELGDYYFEVEALHGVQVRAPLLDVRLVEWSLAIPEDQYFRNAQPRWLAKRLLSGRVPQSMLATRREADQIADWHWRMTRDLPRIREIVDVLAEDADVAGIVDMPRIKRLLDDWPGQPPKRSDPLEFQLQICLPYALTVGRFVRHLKGANL